MEMPKALQEKRDERASTEYQELGYETFTSGFNACWEELAPVVEKVKEIEGIADHDQYLSASERQVALGRILVKARQALAKLEGENNT